MTQKERKAKYAHLQDIYQWWEDLKEVGHTFWHCEAQDTDRGRPWYYVQIHRTVHMSTCSNCGKMMELKNKIRKLQKELNIEQWPLRWKVHVSNVEHLPRLTANSSSEFDINYSMLKS